MIQCLKKFLSLSVGPDSVNFSDSSGYEDAIQEADRIEQLKRSQSKVESCLRASHWKKRERERSAIFFSGCSIEWMFL